MKKTFIIMLNSLRRSRGLLIISLIGGLALCLFFYQLANLVGQSYSKVSVGLLAGEDTKLTQDFRRYIKQDLEIEIVENRDISVLNTELVERHISAIIQLPEGFMQSVLKGSPIPLQVSFTDDYENGAFIQGYLENYMSGLRITALGAAGDETRLAELLEKTAENKIEISAVSAKGETMQALQQREAFGQIMGFFMQFSFFLAFGTAFQIMDDRKHGVFNRVKTTNVKTSEYLTGICLVGIISAFSLIAPFFIYLLAIKPDIGSGLLPAVVLALAFTLFVVGVAVACAMYFDSRNAVIACIIGVATIMSLLGSAYFPIESSPDILQKMARATPQFWFMDAVKNLQIDSGFHWWWNAGIILLFALFCFVLAGVRFVDTGKRKNVV